MQNPSSGLVALILGILGLTALPLIGSIIALVFGYQSRREVRENPGRYSDDFGRVGRILGWIGVAIFGVLILVGVLILLFFAVGTGSSDGIVPGEVMTFPAYD